MEQLRASILVKDPGVVPEVTSTEPNVERHKEVRLSFFVLTVI